MEILHAKSFSKVLFNPPMASVHTIIKQRKGKRKIKIMPFSSVLENASDDI